MLQCKTFSGEKHACDLDRACERVRDVECHVVRGGVSRRVRDVECHVVRRGVSRREKIRGRPVADEL